MIKEEKNNIVSEEKNLTALITEQAKDLIHDMVQKKLKGYMTESIIKEDDEESEDVESIEMEVKGDEVSEPNTEIEDIDIEDIELSDIEDEVLDMGAESSVDTEDAWDEFSDYKVSDEGDYDFTEADDTTLAKVYKLLKNDDKVIIKQEGNNVEIKDDETGAEYIVQVATEESLEENCEKLEVTESAEDFVGIEDQEGEEDEVLDLTTLGDEVEIEDEPETVEEITTITGNNARKASKTHTSNTRKVYLPKGSRNISTAGDGYVGGVNESIVNQAMLIKEENEKLKSHVNKIKETLQEAVVANANLTHIVKLFMENSTTRKEKEAILSRFSENVETLKEGKQLYKTITHELNETKTKSDVLRERTMKVEGSLINETIIHESDSHVKNILSLMERVDKKN